MGESSIHKKINEVGSKVDALCIHVDYIKIAVDEIRVGHKVLNRFKNMTYGICAFLIVVLPLIVVVK